MAGITYGDGDTYTYNYNTDGDIESIEKNGVIISSYEYDLLGELIRENDIVSGKTYLYNYDEGGNLVSAITYAYTTKETALLSSLNAEKTDSYTYGDSEWKDLLTAFNGEEITYDEIGNPLSYRDGYSFTWKYGRSLATVINPFRYRGYYYDNETGFYYLNSRYYDSITRRFLNADETYYVSFDAYNLFSYCLDNPVSYIDATGGVATAIAISTYTITELSSALTMIVANLQVAVNAVKTAIVSSAFVVVAVAATVIAAVALKKIFDKIKYCMADADTVKKAVEKVKDKIQSYRNNTVYVIQEKNDNSKNAKVVYVGRTNNFERRKKEHQRSRFPEDKYDMYAVATGLTYNESRALEQTLISAYMLCYLSNCINSISVKKWSNFKHEFSNMKTLMEAAVDPE